MDLILPGHGPTDDKLEEIWAFVDSSGSISKDELSQFLTQLHRIVKEFGCITNICYWDTEVTDTYLKIKSEKALSAWFNKAGNINLECINTFIKGCYNDMPAIVNSIKYQYSNGVVEASVNKIKLIKRIMHGRCKFDLLKSKTLRLEFLRKIN